MTEKTKSRTRPTPLRTPDARVSALGIARETARAIERGIYGPGQRLREQELADQFKCSRAPVREALRILESQGSVVIEPMKGARVATVDDSSFYEVFLIRRALAGLIIQQVARAQAAEPKTAFLERARSLTPYAETCTDGHEFASRIRFVIQAMIAAAQTPRTMQLIRSITFGYLAFQDDIAESKKSRRAQARFWKRMADAAEDGDLTEARAAMDDAFDYAFAYVADIQPGAKSQTAL